MTCRKIVPLIVLVALCGCDRWGKKFPSFAPSAKKMMAAPPRQAVAPVVAEPPFVEPQTTPVEPEPPVSETPPAEATVEAAPTSPAAPLILYQDSFADVAGSIRRKVDGKQQPGEGSPASRTVYTFQAMPEDGTLTMRVFEDNMTAGPDGEPGLMAMAWDAIPKKLHYSGFVYLGGAAAGRRMTLPKVQAARTADDLGGLRLKFRYRGINPSSDAPVQLQINCRLEPLFEDSYGRRVDFGTLVATDEWQSFDLALSDGKNLDAFLKTLAEDNPPSFKIVWGQAIPIEHYRAGDTLLIDDVSVTSVPVPVE